RCTPTLSRQLPYPPRQNRKTPPCFRPPNAPPVRHQKPAPRSRPLETSTNKNANSKIASSNPPSHLSCLPQNLHFHRLQRHAKRSCRAVCHRAIDFVNLYAAPNFRKRLSWKARLAEVAKQDFVIRLGRVERRVDDHLTLKTALRVGVGDHEDLLVVQHSRKGKHAATKRRDAEMHTVA